jgi:hypothetical protein
VAAREVSNYEAEIELYTATGVWKLHGNGVSYKNEEGLSRRKTE